MSLNNDKEFRFIFEDNSELCVPKEYIFEISQTFYIKNINNNDQNIIKMPKHIKQKDLDNFVKLFQKYIFRLREFNFDVSFVSLQLLLEGYSTNISKFIQISEFFESYNFSTLLIKDCLLSDRRDNDNMDNNHKMNIENSIIFLDLSYNKLKEINSKDNICSKNISINFDTELETAWLDLFIKSLEMIGNNLRYFFINDKDDNFTNNKLWNFDKKIIDELYEKFFLNLIIRNYIIISNEIELDSNLNQNYIDLKELDKIINFLIKKRNQNDFFGLLSNEYMKIISEENINELNSLPNPTFILKININEIDTFYEEYTINNSFNMNDSMKLKIIVYYKKNEDSFHVALKLSKDKNNKTIKNFDIITYLSLVLVEEIGSKQINVKSLYNNKSMYEILKITNFKKIITTKNHKIGISAGNEYLTLKLFLKPCFIHTMLCNYLFYNLENLYNNKNVTNLSKNLLSIIIKKKQLIKNEENNSCKDNKELKTNNYDKIVTCLINWLNDEINIGEDLSEIIKNITWDNVSLSLIFEFLIKYSIHIISDDIEFIFSKSLCKILKQFEGDIGLLSKEIIHSLISASKKLNFISIFCENKKIKKFNLYEMMNKRRNISFQLDKKNSGHKDKHYKIINKDINRDKNKKKYKDLNKDFNNNFNTEKIQDELTIISKDLSISKDKDNSKKIKNDEHKLKRKIKIGNNNSPIENKFLSSYKNKNNISFINNSDIYYNNYFSNCSNNFNINIYKPNKSNNNIKNLKINLSQNKKKPIISQIKIKPNNNIHCIKPNNNTNNKSKKISFKPNTPDSCSNRMKNKLIKFNTNKFMNKTINFKNTKNLDKQLIKEKLDRSINKSNKSNKSNKNKCNFSEIRNKTSINERNSHINYKKYSQKKKIDESIENDTSKKDKNKTHISLLNELLKYNKKEKKTNKLEIKRNNYNMLSNIKKQNLTLINFENKSTKENIQ